MCHVNIIGRINDCSVELNNLPTPVLKRVYFVMCRSIKHYFLLDQGDFVVQFMDMAEDELKKTMDHILFGRELWNGVGTVMPL